MDALGEAAGVKGLLSLSLQVTRSLEAFYAPYRTFGDDIDVLHQRLDKLHGLLSVCNELALNEPSRFKDAVHHISDCESAILECQQDLEKINQASGPGLSSNKTARHSRVLYPFRQSTLQKISENVAETSKRLSLALSILQIEQSEFEVVRGTVTDLVRSARTSSTLHEWLAAPDPSIDFIALSARIQPRTTEWYTEGPAFKSWLDTDNAFIWLHGISGSGKSVLSTAVIRQTFRFRRNDSRIAIAFFFFTFSDSSKQTNSAMLRSLISQLSGQLSDGGVFIEKLRASSPNRATSTPVLMEWLRELVKLFEKAYIFLDGLDESPTNLERSEVLESILDIRAWSIQGLHLFVSSRNELDIRHSLKSLDTQANKEVILGGSTIDNDIGLYVTARLAQDPRLRKWAQYHDQIKQALVANAQGMFRWVECQLFSLAVAPVMERHLSKVLTDMPKSLDETYERILLSIEGILREPAQRILMMICFAPRPLTAFELIDAEAVDLSSRPGLDRKRRLLDANDICNICPSLLHVVEDERCVLEAGETSSSARTVMLSHFSVKDYLQSGRIRMSKANYFGMLVGASHAEIACICLSYLLDPTLSDPELHSHILDEMPLAQYAAQYWHYHYERADTPSTAMNTLVLELFDLQNPSFQNWVRLHNIDAQCKIGDEEDENNHDANSARTDLDLNASAIATPLYYGSLLGLECVISDYSDDTHRGGTSRLTDQKALPSPLRHQVDREEGNCGNALCGASYGGHPICVLLLIDMGFDINRAIGQFGTPLVAASIKGHAHIVKLLLDNGANIQGSSQLFGNALSAAASQGFSNVVQILLQKDVDINAVEGKFGSALHAACFQGGKPIISLLLESGANINLIAGEYGTPIQAASVKGFEDAFDTLVKSGADPFIKGGRYHNTLQAACYGGNEHIVHELLCLGLDVNQSGGRYGNALQAASAGGHYYVVELLLQKEAEVEARSGKFGSALQAASSQGHGRILHRLLEAKADVNFCGGACGTALIAASGGGVVPVVLQLLHAGANVTTSTDTGWTALHEAAKNGNAEVIQVLLDWGARIDAVDVNRSTAIHEAVSHECWGAQDLLIALGASIDIRNCFDQTVIDLAWSKKQLDWAAYSLDNMFTQQIKQGRQARCEVLRRQANSMNIPEVRVRYPFASDIDLPSQLVFCKRFSLAGSTTQKVRKYLLREHAILQKLDHPYVISYLGYDEDVVRGNAAIYLEFCDGQDLRKHVPEATEDDDSIEENTSDEENLSHASIRSTAIPLQENEVWQYIFQLSAAVAYLHHGLSIRKDDLWCFEARWDSVIHRDIKPANVVLKTTVSSKRLAKLCDLGLVRSILGEEKQTRSIGSLDYSPPEVRKRKGWTIKGDIYALGMTVKDLSKAFTPRPPLTTLLDDCTRHEKSERPSSLTVLEISVKHVSEGEGLPKEGLQKFFGQDADGYLYQALKKIASALDDNGDFDLELTKSRRRRTLDRLNILCGDGAGNFFDQHSDSLHLSILLRRQDKFQSLLNRYKCGHDQIDQPWEVSGWTPLHLALQERMTEVADVLINHGADQAALDSHLKRPKDYTLLETPIPSSAP